MKYVVKYFSPLGEYDQKYGQRYYGKAHDEGMDVSFNLMNPINFEDGEEIEFDEKVIKEKGPQSKNPGEEYLFLKKVRKVGGSQAVGGVNTSTQPIKAESSTTPAATPEYEAGTNARWAIGMAYRAFIQATGSPEGPDGGFPFDAVMQHASALVKMFDELKNGGSLDSSGSAIKETPPSATGLDKARATAETIKAKQEMVETADELFPGETDEAIE